MTEKIALETVRQITLALSTALYKVHGEKSWSALAETVDLMFTLNLINDPAAIMYLDILVEKKSRHIPVVV